MRKNSLTVRKSLVVLAMLTPAVALANSHGAYSYATVTPTAVAPGDHITVEFEYTVSVSDSSTTSLWAVFFDAGNGQHPYDAGGIKLAEDKPSTGNGTHTFTLAGPDAIVVQVPETAEPGQYPINIFSCAASYQPVANFRWYQEDSPGGGAGPILITVVEEEQDIIDFFDSAVADGTLLGTGSFPAVARFRLNLMRALLEIADFLIVEEQVDLALFFLELAYDFTDGQPGPMDLVEGNAAPELATRIQALIDSLG